VNGDAGDAHPSCWPGATGDARSATPCSSGSRSAITPAIGATPVYLAGFDNDRKASGVHDDLWARAVAVSDGRQQVAIVSVDLIGVFHADVLKAREALQRKAPGAVLVVASTHNHEGPDTMGLWGSGRFSSGVDRQYLESVRQAIAETAREALSRLAPARLVLGKTRTPGLIEDGRLPRVVDDTLVAMQAIGKDGRTLGTVVNWSSHPEALGAKNTLVTSDFPHFLRARVEERLGGTCVFLVGSIGGLMTPLGVKPATRTGRRSRRTASPSRRRWGSAPPTPRSRRSRPGRPPLPPPSSTAAPPSSSRSRTASSASPRSWASSTARCSPTSARRPRSSATTCGPRWAISGSETPRSSSCPPRSTRSWCSGDPEPQDPGADFPGAPREPALFSLLSSEYRLVIGLANDEIGYVIPRSQWDAKKPFAYGRLEDQYGEVNSAGPSAAARLAEAFARLRGAARP
jgi:hypothetical protein